MVAEEAAGASGEEVGEERRGEDVWVRGRGAGVFAASAPEASSLLHRGPRLCHRVRCALRAPAPRLLWCGCAPPHGGSALRVHGDAASVTMPRTRGRNRSGPFQTPAPSLERRWGPHGRQVLFHHGLMAPEHPRGQRIWHYLQIHVLVGHCKRDNLRRFVALKLAGELFDKALGVSSRARPIQNAARNAPSFALPPQIERWAIVSARTALCAQRVCHSGSIKLIPCARCLRSKNGCKGGCSSECRGLLCSGISQLPARRADSNLPIRIRVCALSIRRRATHFPW